MTGRRSWVVGLSLVLLGIGAMVLIGGNAAAGRAPQSVPTDSDSARLDRLARQFPGGDEAPLIMVVSRADGAVLDPADIAATQAACDRMQALARPLGAGGALPALVSADGKAAIGVVQLAADLSGLVLTDKVARCAAPPNPACPSGLRAHVTGGPAFGADIANAFAGANVTLLAVTASVVALLLIVTYRSPVLWLVPLLVIGFADRLAAAAGTAVASLTGLSFDGATAGITSVLVFGAGTNYALLLISRYRQELRRHTEHREALRLAVRKAGPAIVASNATVVLALLTLLFASTPSTRSLGALAACGLVVAAVSVLVLLPPLLALCGRAAVLAVHPAPRDDDALDSGRLAPRRRPGSPHGPPWSRRSRSRFWRALAAACWAPTIGLVPDRAVPRQGAIRWPVMTLSAAHFPAGLTDPTLRHRRAPRGRPQVQRAIRPTPGVVSAVRVGPARHRADAMVGGPRRRHRPPGRRSTPIVALRDSTPRPSPPALVGGADAQALDVRDAAAHDRLMLIPAILAVVLVVLFVLLRSALAPPLCWPPPFLVRWPPWASAAGSSMHAVRIPGAWTTARRCSPSCSWSPSAWTTPSSWSPAPVRRHRGTAPATASCVRCRRPAASSPARESCWRRCSACSACCR